MILLSHDAIKQFFSIQEGRSWREAAAELRGNPPQNTKEQMCDQMRGDRKEICLRIYLHPLHCLSALDFHYVRRFSFVVYVVKKTALYFQGT